MPFVTSPADTSPALERDETYWLANGDIIVVAQTTGFKVRSSVLSKQSPVLHEMVRAARALTTHKPFLHCPVIRVDDSPQAFRCVLDHLMANPSSTPMGSEDPVEQLYWQIHMGVKYGISQLVNAAAGRLSTINLTDEFLLYCASINLQPRPNDAKQAIVAVNLARMLQRPSLLPSALLACSQVFPHDLLQSIALSDGTVLAIPPEYLARALNANGALHEAALDVARQVFAPPASPECVRRDTGLCAEGLRKLAYRRPGELADIAPIGAQPFRLWSVDLARLPDPYRLCAPCADMVQKREGVVMRAAWAALPCVLDVVIPGWGGNACTRHCVNPTEANVCVLDRDADGESVEDSSFTDAPSDHESDRDADGETDLEVEPGPPSSEESDSEE